MSKWVRDTDGKYFRETATGKIRSEAAGGPTVDCDCSCGALLTQWRRCSDGTLSDLWSPPEPTVPAYMRWKYDALCYYKDGTEPEGTPDEAGIIVTPSVLPNYDLGDYIGLPVGEDCTSEYCDPVPCFECTGGTGDTPGAIIAVVEDVVIHEDCIDELTDCGFSGGEKYSGDMNGTYLMLYKGGCVWEAELPNLHEKEYESGFDHVCVNLLNEYDAPMYLRLDFSRPVGERLVIVSPVLGGGEHVAFKGTVVTPLDCMDPSVVGANSMGAVPRCFGGLVQDYYIGSGGTITLTPISPIP